MAARVLYVTGRSFVALALLVGIQGFAPFALAGSITDGSAAITIVVLNDRDPEPLINFTKHFAVSEPITLEIGPLGSLEAAALVTLDPDPVASYEFGITNTTENLLFGALVVEFDIAPVAGGVPGSSFLEVIYEDAGAETFGPVQHLSMVVSCDIGQKGDGIILDQLKLNASTAAPGVTTLSAGPVAIPEAPDGTFDRLCVQLSFNRLAPGDSAAFAGTTQLPEPDSSLLLLSALAAIRLVMSVKRYGERRTLQQCV